MLKERVRRDIKVVHKKTDVPSSVSQLANVDNDQRWAIAVFETTLENMHI